MAYLHLCRAYEIDKFEPRSKRQRWHDYHSYERYLYSGEVKAWNFQGFILTLRKSCHLCTNLTHTIILYLFDLCQVWAACDRRAHIVTWNTLTYEKKHRALCNCKDCTICKCGGFTKMMEVGQQVKSYLALARNDSIKAESWEDSSLATNW